MIASCIISLLFTQYHTVSQQYSQISDLNQVLRAKNTSYNAMIQRCYNRDTLINGLETYYGSPATRTPHDSHITYTFHPSTRSQPLLHALELMHHFRGTIHAIHINFALQYIRITLPTTSP